MNGWSTRTIVFWLATCGLLLARPVPADEPNAVNPDTAFEERLADLVEKLSSNQYVQREMASLELAKMGNSAVPALADAVKRGDLETTERAMQLLQRVAVAEMPKDDPVGWQAIKRLAEQASGTASTRARTALRTIAIKRQEIARGELQKHGILVGLSNFVLDASTINAEIAHIPATWDGDTESLAWLAWLHGVQYVAMEGPSIDGSVIERAVQMPDVHFVVIVNANITTDDLQPLKQLKRIDQLELRYTTTDDSAAEFIAQLPIRQKLILNGTKVTPDGLETITKRLVGIQIDYKRGGFLGVNCDPWDARCEITRTVVGGAAEQAGLMAGDIVVKVDDKPIGRFADLQDAIATYPPGSEVAITAERLGETKVFKAKLGTLQSDPQ